MTIYEQLFVDKGFNPFADLLVTFGLSRIVGELLELQTKNRYQITLYDRGTCYELRLNPPLAETQLGHPIYTKAIQTLKTKLPEGIAVYNYEDEKAIVNAYFDARKQQVDLPPPAAHWDVLRAINPAALLGYNSLMVNWHTVMGDPEVLQLLLNLFRQTPNDLVAATEQWKQLAKLRGWAIEVGATAQQLYNPDSGKGQNRAKADGLSIGNVDNFWLLEWLKAVGFYEGALTKLVRGAKDRKTIVVAPRELTYRDHQAVMSDFSRTMQYAEMPARFDILAVVRYLRSLLKHQFADDRLAQLFKNPLNIKKQWVSGFYTAFYKDMGNAIVTMNMAFIALPGWITVKSREEVGLYKQLLEEFERFVQQFDESHSDAFGLLQYLRDFVSADDLQAFFRFTSAFPAYLMGMRERNKPAKQLTTDFIERLIMSSEKRLTPILESVGFQNIAYAIRQSTITAQYRKKQGDRKYDVRYGLGQELARKARYPQEFITALADFLHKYNAENAQIMETRQGPYRRSIHTTDIDEVVRLIDEYGSETVANLLIAYGYARLPREDGVQDDEHIQENHHEEQE